MQNSTNESIVFSLFEDGTTSSIPDDTRSSDEENPELMYSVQGLNDIPCLPDLLDDWLDEPADKFLHKPSLASCPFTSDYAFVINNPMMDGNAIPPLSSDTSSNDEKHCRPHVNIMSVELGCDPQNLEWAPFSTRVPFSVVEYHSGGICSASPLRLETSKKSPSLLKMEGCLKARVSQSMQSPKSTKRYACCRGDKKSVEFLVESSTTPIDDGYTWLKYGQKNINNRRHPRGYFRCAHQNCPVKKQTEISSDMQGFVSITYFHKHNHLRMHA